MDADSGVASGMDTEVEETFCGSGSDTETEDEDYYERMAAKRKRIRRIIESEPVAKRRCYGIWRFHDTAPIRTMEEIKEADEKEHQRKSNEDKCAERRIAKHQLVEEFIGQIVAQYTHAPQPLKERSKAVNLHDVETWSRCQKRLEMSTDEELRKWNESMKILSNMSDVRLHQTIVSLM